MNQSTKPWQNIIDFWFGADDPPPKSYFKLWFSGGNEVDQAITEQFSGTYQSVIHGECESWLSDPLGRLACIIVIDQFSRNIYRGEAAAFAWDHLSQKWAIEGWQQEAFSNLSLSQQMFVAMPLVHGENLLSQDYALAVCKNLLDKQAPPNEMISSFYSSIQKHRDIIRTFGRYPHRNGVLGRKSTNAEQAYLAGDAKRFGQ